MLTDNVKGSADTVELLNGVKIPCVGFGTWQIEGSAAELAAAEAVRAGYRHIDTASAYGFDGAAFSADNTHYVSGLAGGGDAQRANP